MLKISRRSIDQKDLEYHGSGHVKFLLMYTVERLGVCLLEVGMGHLCNDGRYADRASNKSFFFEIIERFFVKSTQAGSAAWAKTTVTRRKNNTNEQPRTTKRNYSTGNDANLLDHVPFNNSSKLLIVQVYG